MKGFIAIEDKIVAFLYDNDRTTLKRLKYKGDAPEDFKKLKERRLAERRIMTIKSSRRRTRGKNAGFSPLANMLTLAAYERACRTSSGICELAFCALRRSKQESTPLRPKEKNNRQPQGLSVIFLVEVAGKQGKNS